MYICIIKEYLEILKQARENGCNWNEDTCTYASISKHLELLKWAYENGCEYNKIDLMNLVKNSKIKKWIKINPK